MKQEKLKSYKCSDGGELVMKPLMLGQGAALLMLLTESSIFDALDNVGALLSALGEDLIPAAAIVLQEIDSDLETRDLAALEKRIANKLPLELLPEVIADFLDLIRASSLVEKLTAVIRDAKLSIQPPPSSGPSADSPAETPQSTT